MPRLASTHAPREIAAQVPPSTTHITCMSRSPLYLLSSAVRFFLLLLLLRLRLLVLLRVERRRCCCTALCLSRITLSGSETTTTVEDKVHILWNCGMFSESSTLPLLLHCDLFLHTQSSHMMSIERAANESTADNLRTQRSEPGSHLLLKVMFSYLDRRPISR